MMEIDMKTKKQLPKGIVGGDSTGFSS